MSGEATNQETSTRPTWSKGTEFLMSCIALSVGLGNIWRFPFTVYENGGASFLVVYLIVLFFIGKPFYFIEMIMGQFTSRGSFSALQVVPLMKGIAFGQQIASATIASYYSSIVALTLFYLIQSFQSELPWTKCLEKYGSNCAPSNLNQKFTNTSRSSTELYFYEEVMRQKNDISDGIGLPDYRLSLCLLVSWTCVFLSIVKSIKSSGKLSYFFALFPYIVLISLLIKACTLEGSINGILFFIKPDMRKIFNPTAWYNAVVQIFFSLSVGTGTVLMYSGYNKFHRNIYRDAMIVSIVDSCTSLLAGFTIFAILGNLAHNLGVEDIGKVVKGGHGLAFFSFPEAISKMNYWYWPQIMSVIFFFMIFVLGVGSSVGLLNNLTTNLQEILPKFKYWQIALVCSICGFLIGLLYITQGGLHILSLADYFGGTMLVFFLATLQIIGIFWIYGLENFCWDVEFMLKRKISIFWRISWCFVIPFFMITISIYLIISMENPKIDGNNDFPAYALAGGWGLLVFGLLQVLIWIVVLYFKDYKIWYTKISFGKFLVQKSDSWKPKSQDTQDKWETYRFEIVKRKTIYIQKHEVPWLVQKWWVITGNYPDGVMRGMQNFY